GIEVKGHKVPMSRSHVMPGKLDGTAFIQPPHKPQAESDIFKQRPFNAGKATGGTIDPQLAAERTKNTQLAGWGVVVRSWREPQPNQTVLLAVVLKVEGIRAGAEQLANLVLICLFAFLMLGPLSLVFKKLAHAFVIFRLLRNRLPVPENGPGYFAL